MIYVKGYSKNIQSNKDSIHDKLLFILNRYLF